jgi:hypothetical protein
MKTENMFWQFGLLSARIKATLEVSGGKFPRMKKSPNEKEIENNTETCCGNLDFNW